MPEWAEQASMAQTCKCCTSIASGSRCSRGASLPRCDCGAMATRGDVVKSMMMFLEAELVEKLPGGGERPKFPTVAAYLAHHYPTEAA